MNKRAKGKERNQGSKGENKFTSRPNAKNKN
jgi:hypothetical protein